MNAWDLGNIALIDYWFPWRENDLLSLEISVKYQGIALGSSLHHQFQNHAPTPRQSALVNRMCVRPPTRGTQSPDHGTAFTNRIFVRVLYLGMCDNTYLGHNQVAVLDTFLYFPHTMCCDM